MKKDLIKRSDALDKRIKASGSVDKSIENLIKASESNRKLINWVIISIIFEVVLTMVVIYVAVRTSQNTIRIERNRDILVNNCVVGNEFRATEKSFWEYILTIPPDQPVTPQQQQRIDAFKVKLDETFAQRPCEQLKD